MKYKKILGFAIFIAVALGISLFFKDNIIDFVNNIEQFGVFAPIVYGAIYTVLTIIGFPTSILSVLAGTLFGFWTALTLVVISATLAGTIAFFIARYFSDVFISLKNKSIKKFVRTINEKSEKNGFGIIAILRLSFLPYIPLSYAAGFVKNLKARDFIAATFLTNIFGSLIFVFLGLSITKSLPLVIAAIVLVIIFMQTPKVIKKIRNKDKKSKSKQ